jgi:hypothetical protein
MDNIHPIPLDAFVEFLAGVTPFAGVDVGFGQRNFSDHNVRFYCHGRQHPIK